MESEADTATSNEYVKTSSHRSAIAAWTGSVAVHAGVVVGLYALVPSLVPVPERPSVLSVSVIESIEATQPRIHSTETAASSLPRKVVKQPPRVAHLSAPVVVARAPQSTTVPAAAAETRPAAQIRSSSMLPKRRLRRSVVVAPRAESIETDVATRQKSPNGKVSVKDLREVPRMPSAQPQRVRRSSASNITREAADSPKRRGIDLRKSPRLHEGEAPGMVTSSAAIGVKKTQVAATLRSVNALPEAAPKVIPNDSRLKEMRVLDRAPTQVRVTPASRSGSGRPMEKVVPETRTKEIVRSQAEHRVDLKELGRAIVPVPRQSQSVPLALMSDFSWLAQAVHSRIAQMKSYPYVARVNQWEGRVVLKAVIREDGELAALSVRTSSGHDELDEDAMKLVRQICPVPLTHPLGRSEITVHIPITYKLDR